MPRTSVILVAITILVILFDLVSFNSAFPFLNRNDECEFRETDPHGFECEMNCAFLADERRICSYNLTEVNCYCLCSVNNSNIIFTCIRLAKKKHAKT